ncbi:hypothetical protein Pfo_014710 [Paulownia fortunei]|nr:hypothetical protein Pfo_014710 [Paulownia fortunei]
MEGCSFSWNTEDLLAASAEQLGRGTLGGTYKVILDEKTTVVVKRLKVVKITRREFEQQIQFLGSIRHENIVPIIAYFYFQETMCLVYDFCKQSVGSMPHDKIGKKSKPLDWDTRQRIAIGKARGLSHIHAQRGGKLVHGNINASNIFLNSQQYGCMSDHCLVIDKVNVPPPMQNTGYLSPEIIHFGQVSQESDSPDRVKLGNKVVCLVRWVNYVSSKKGTSKLILNYVSKLVKNPFMEEEMVKMLLIGMHCGARKPEQRPKMPDILKMMERLER